MRAVVDSGSYNEAVTTVCSLIGQEVDCLLTVKGGKVTIEASNAEGYVKVPLKVEEAEGEGRVYSKVEYLSTIKAKGSLTMIYEQGSDHIAVDMGRSRGAIRILNASDAKVVPPKELIKIAAVVPAQTLIFATGATAFKPLLSASAPNAVLEIDNKTLTLSSNDTYIGTHYSTHNEDLKSKGSFKLVVEMDYWRSIIGCTNGDMTFRAGADDRYFRIKTERFDLYHAVIDTETQNVGNIIQGLKDQDSLAVIELDGKDVTEAIESAKGILRAGGKEEARFTITLSQDTAVLAAESAAGEMESEIDISGYESEEEISFSVSPDSFADTLKLTRDEGLKYSNIRLTVLQDFLVMESLKVPASSIAPVIQE
jgi:DNA polymerase III sliding clamp (beta) subunit (PCNA family)